MVRAEAGGESAVSVADSIPCLSGRWIGNAFAEPGAKQDDRYCLDGLTTWCWNAGKVVVVEQRFVGGENVGNEFADVYDGGPTLIACFDRIRAEERQIS